MSADVSSRTSSVRGLIVQRVLQRRKVRRLDFELSLADAPDTVEQPSRRWTGSAFTVLVVHAAVAWTHEQPSLREPSHRAAEVGTVHGEDQEAILLFFIRAEVADIDAHVGRHAVPGSAEGILEGLESRLVERELLRRAEFDPMHSSLAG